MGKKPFIIKQKRKRHGTAFWDREYTSAENLRLSIEPSEDLEKFMRWHQRQKNIVSPLVDGNCVLDMGCGNGRNLIYLAKDFGLEGTGCDSSSAAIASARSISEGLPIKYQNRSIAEPIELPEESQDLVLDMMASHFLNETERLRLRDEIYRVLKPGGWFFLKTFLLDEDKHTERLLKEYPAKETHTYIHPVIGVPEHVFSERELIDFYEEKFILHKVYRSHKHVSKGRARKRRTISVYMEKDPYR